MKYVISIDIITDSNIDLEGLPGAITYVLRNQLKTIPGISEVVITEAGIE